VAGPAYAEFADSAFAAAEAARLEELRLVAAETGFEIDLVLGDEAALVPELQKALAQQPTRERLWELLIRALYLSGRQSDALLGYLRARDVLLGRSCVPCMPRSWRRIRLWTAPGALRPG
jgi:DNA-binding SARP family transcriptional activator